MIERTVAATPCHLYTPPGVLGILLRMLPLDPSSARRLKISIFIFGLAFRFVWTLCRGLSADELTSLSYVLSPGLNSAFWDNSPPTFYLLMKAAYLVVSDEWFLRVVAFAISSVSFVIFFRFLDREENGNLWLLGFWAVYPTSVVNATFRPTILIELAGIIFYLASRSRSLGRLVGGCLALMATSYLGFIAPLVALGDEPKPSAARDRKKLVILVCAIFVAAVGLLRIRWQSLTWLRSGSVIDLGASSFLMLSQLWGFSLPLFLAVTWTLARARKISRSFIVIVLLVALGPILTGHRFASSRFLIFLSPWVLISIATVLRLRRDFWVGALVVIIPAVTTIWFLLHEKSGWVEAGRYVAATGEKAIVYVPQTMASYLSPRFVKGDLDMDLAISKHIANGGWILRPNPSRDIRMLRFLPEGGHPGYDVKESRVFGENSLEPVLAVHIVPKN